MYNLVNVFYKPFLVGTGMIKDFESQLL